MSLVVVPITLREARRFIGETHRHNLPPSGWKFGCGVTEDGSLVGVGVAGQPVARLLDDGLTVEITRVSTAGHRNACSKLYGALCRAAFALGYRRVVTYTLATEPGTSLRAAGFSLVAELDARAGWDTPSRPRVVADLFGVRQTPHGEAKVRWERRAPCDRERITEALR